MLCNIYTHSLCVCVCLSAWHIPCIFPRNANAYQLQIATGSDVDNGSDRIIISRRVAIAAVVAIVVVVVAAVDDKTVSRRLWQVASGK